MYAIISAGNKQYRVSQGETIYIDKVNLEDGAVVQNCKNIYNDGGAVYLSSGNSKGTASFTMSGTARMESNEARTGGAVYVANAPAAVTISGGTMQNNTARKNGG